MSKHLIVPAALVAVLAFAPAPLVARQLPSNGAPATIGGAEPSGPAGLLPAINPARESPRLTSGAAQEPEPSGTAAHVKVFDGNTGAELRAADEPATAAKATLYGRKAGDDRRTDATPEGNETAADRAQSQNNLKQLGLANTAK